eukprot:6242122-Pyramimonas_sp.AAC.1
MADLETALSKLRGVIGMGLDGQNLKLWAQLSSEGRQELPMLPRQVEESLTWPRQVRDNVVQLQHKSDVADRPVTLTQGLYRCWSVMRRDGVS